MEIRISQSQDRVIRRVAGRIFADYSRWHGLEQQDLRQEARLKTIEVLSDPHLLNKMRNAPNPEAWLGQALKRHLSRYAQRQLNLIKIPDGKDGMVWVQRTTPVPMGPDDPAVGGPIERVRRGSGKPPPERKLAEWWAAWLAAVTLLSDGEWHPYLYVVEAMCDAGKVTEGECKLMLQTALRRPKDVQRDQGMFRLTDYGRRFLQGIPA